jgi:hypothetical protein
LISAESEWVDVYAYAQFLLERHEEGRALIDESRRRAKAAARVSGELGARTWPEIEQWSRRSRSVRDYRAAVLKAARFLCLGEDRAEIVHELAGRSGYRLERPSNKAGPCAPAPQVASAAGADLIGEQSWRSGATANRQARLRYLSTTASRTDRVKFHFTKGSI